MNSVLLLLPHVAAFLVGPGPKISPRVSRHIRATERVIRNVKPAYAVAATAIAAASGAPADEPLRERSALVCGWFGASERELRIVKRVYARNGFKDVTIVPSGILQLTQPMGWFRTFRSNLAQGAAHPLARHFDVVHVMSGGFLQLYLARAARVPLSWGALILDSTPILPTPRSFANFQRELLSERAKPRTATLVRRLFPRRLHEFLVHASWLWGTARVRLACKLARARAAVWPSGDLRERELLTLWVRLTMASAFRGRYDRLIDHISRTALTMSAAPPHGAAEAATAAAVEVAETLGATTSLYWPPLAAGSSASPAIPPTAAPSASGADAPDGMAADPAGAPRADAPRARTLFVYNPEDPFISQSDVERMISSAESVAGAAVEPVLVTTKHVQTIFQAPSTIFDAVGPGGDSGGNS